MFVFHVRQPLAYLCEGLISSVCHSGGRSCPKFMHKSKNTKIMVGDELHIKYSKAKKY